MTLVIGDRSPAGWRRWVEREAMPLNDDEKALSDEAYAALLAEAETNAEPCPVAVPPDALADALDRLDQENADG